MYVTVCSSYQMKSTDNIETEFAEVTADPLKQGFQRMARGPQIARGALCRGPPTILKKITTNAIK